MRHPSRQTRVRSAGLVLALSLTGCAGPRFHERQRLADRACGFDQDRSVLYLRNKIEAAREGSFGGFGGAAAGGCGCQ